MKRNTQRIIAGLVVFMMIASILAAVFAGNTSSAPGAIIW